MMSLVEDLIEVLFMSTSIIALLPLGHFLEELH